MVTVRDNNFQLKRHEELLVPSWTHVESTWQMVVQAEPFNKVSRSITECLFRKALGGRDGH